MTKTIEWVETLVEKMVGYTCDICGKEKLEMYEFDGYHERYPESLSDTCETYHVCSGKCYFEALGKLLLEVEEYGDDATIDRKPYKLVKEMFSYYKKSCETK